MNRRELVRLLAGAAFTGAAGRLYAAPAGGPRFLLVFLRGGYDAANLLVPYASNYYYEARPNLAIARPDPASTTGALALDADWALAPAVRDTIGAMYGRGEAAFVPFAGTEDLSRSHFETQDSIELGQPLGGSRDYRSGFLGRLLEVVSPGAEAVPIAFTQALPLAFQGVRSVPNLSLAHVGRSPFDERQAHILADLYAGRSLEPMVREGLELRHEVAQDMSDEMNRSGRNAVPARGFELEAERMGVLMRDKYRLGFVDVGGWDTHVGEGGAEGTLATHLKSLGQGLDVFARTLGDAWRDTVVVVVSEFGRTFRENGNRGTDHGHGTVYWVLGGAVAGGAVRGEQRRVARDTLLQDRDYPVLNDYRAVLGGMFRRLWGLSPTQCTHVFARVEPADLKLV